MICLVPAPIHTLSCSPVGPECWGGSGKKIVFTVYCVPAAEWLSEFVSHGSEATGRIWGAEPRAGCGLVIRELCRIAGAACSATGRWGQMLGTPHSIKPHVLARNVSFHSALGND